MGRTGWAALLLMGLLACADGSDGQAGDTGVDDTDPCAGLDLPPCPPECPTGWGETCGTACEVEGETCGNSIGDGRSCTDGQWACTVHAPLEPEGCNLVCDPEA